MKEKVFEAGTFNGWRGVIGLYFTRRKNYMKELHERNTTLCQYIKMTL